MQKGSMVEVCSDSSTKRSKWMAMDAKQTTLIIGRYQHQGQCRTGYTCTQLSQPSLKCCAWMYVADPGPSRDQVEYHVPLAHIVDVRLCDRSGSSGAPSAWSFSLVLDGSRASDRLYDISATQDELILEFAARSDTFTEMWVVGLRLCLAEGNGMQFSPVRHIPCARTVAYLHDSL